MGHPKHSESDTSASEGTQEAKCERFLQAQLGKKPV